MGQSVALPEGFKVVHIPASASAAASPGLPAGFRVVSKPNQQAEPAAAPARSWLDSALDFTKGFAHNINPIPALKSIYDDYEANAEKYKSMPGNSGIAMLATGVDVAKNLGKAQLDQFEKGYHAYKDGRYSEAVGHTMAGALPLLGPASADAGETIGSGKVAEGLGKSAAILAPFALKAAVGGLKASKLNAAEEAAVAFGDKEGIPITAGTRTGSKVIKNAEGLVQNAPGGAGFAQKVRNSQTEALAATGDKLAGEITPSAIPAEQVGRNVQQALAGRVATLKAEADAAYSQLRSIEADPVNTKTIQTGTQTVTKNNAIGDPIRSIVPVTKDIPLPVDLTGVKAALKPIFDQLKARMPIAQQQASPGLKAIQNILEGEDHVPASIADANLGAIKAIVRQAESPELRNISQGVAAKAVRELQTAVEKSVAAAGPKAQLALAAGRMATRSKYQVAELLSALPDEPVKLFNRLVSSKDADINLLKEVASQAPAEMPNIGRAYIEGLLDSATAKGGFDNPGTILNQWNRLGPSTKKLLFKGAPTFPQRFDNFLLLAKKIAETPNPSGTAYVGQLVPTGILLVTHPVAGGSLILGNAALSRIMFSAKGSILLSRAMRTPVSNVAFAATAGAELLKMAGDKGAKQ